MAVRKFWLINGQGKKYDLTDFKDWAILKN